MSDVSPPCGSVVPFAVDSTDPAVLGVTYFRLVASTMVAMCLDDLPQIISVLDQVRLNGKRVYTFGNGGSATTATHLASDLTAGSDRARDIGLRAFSLVDNTALLTARANDFDYSDVFAKQLHAFAEPGDAVVAISASGNSPNIIAALRTARCLNLTTIGLLGTTGGESRRLVDFALLVPADDYGAVEAVHLAAVHAIALSLGTGRGRLEECV